MASFNDNIIEEFRRNRGVVGGPFEGSPLLLLTAVGRRSGTPHTTPLAYTTDDGRFVVAASNGGADQDPLWFSNLEANPEATIEVGDRELPVHATVAEPAERDRLFAAHARLMPGFADYEANTDRTIPVVLLAPTT